MKLSSRPGHHFAASRRDEHQATHNLVVGSALRHAISRPAMYLLAALRISLGWVFLWAALDKTFGLGHETTTAQAWINGGSPTYGFLHFSSTGPLMGLYRDLAGHGWADWVFMLGLFGIGIGLTLGVLMRLLAAAAAIMLVLMWSAVLPPANNPFMDDHLIYALLAIGLAVLSAGRFVGLGSWWERQPIVQSHHSLI